MAREDEHPEDRVKAGRAALLSLIVLVVSAGPAAAVTPVLAKAKPWHYWASFVLAASFLGMMFMLVVGYLIRVVGPKYGIRVGKRSEG
jgi:Kef-type K+ transport system membrane component KefB